VKPKARFPIFLGILVVAAIVYYFITTDRSNDMILVGTVDANQVIVSSKIAGRVETLSVEEGTPVKAGDPIATIDSEELIASRNAARSTLASMRSQLGGTQYSEKQASGETMNQVANSQANVAAAHAALAQAQADLERQQLDTQRTVDLANQGVASKQDRDHAEAALRVSQAQVRTLTEQATAAEAALRMAIAGTNRAQTAITNVSSTRGQMAAAEANLAAAETRLGYTKIIAPVTGVVSVWAARQGEVVNPGTPIVTIVDLNDTWVYAAIPETYSQKITLGDTLQVRMPGGEKVAGKVIAKSAEGDFATQRDVSRRKRDIKTVRLKFKIDNPGMKYVPGMTADVLVPQSKLESK
jgi:multidrug resistance efflux pump